MAEGNSFHRLFTVVLGKDIEGIEIAGSFDFLGPYPQIGDTILCVVWPSRLTDPDSDDPRHGEKREVIRLRVIGREFALMRIEGHSEPQISNATLFVERADG